MSTRMVNRFKASYERLGKANEAPAAEKQQAGTDGGEATPFSQRAPDNQHVLPEPNTPLLKPEPDTQPLQSEPDIPSSKPGTVIPPVNPTAAVNPAPKNEKAVNDIFGSVSAPRRQGKTISVYLTYKVLNEIAKLKEHRGLSHSQIIDTALRQVFKIK